MKLLLKSAIYSSCLLVVTAFGASHYVDANNANPASPFTNWATAAITIQDAVDAAAAGDEIVVTNGVFNQGGRGISGGSNRVAVIKPLNLHSVNGPLLTTIEGYQVPGVTNGDAAMRCVYLTDGASLSGFTLTKGATASAGNGGGVLCDSPYTPISNCVFSANSSFARGGGAYYGSLYNCKLSGNSASDGGAGCFAQMFNCTVSSNSAAINGGGLYGGVLNNSVVEGNSAASTGGGAAYSSLFDCLVSNNSAGSSGGGVYVSDPWGGAVDNCTVVGNSAPNGGGVYLPSSNGNINNSIVYFNSGMTGSNYYSTALLNQCCTAPMPSHGSGNITNDPAFRNPATGDLRLQSNSPCINAGNNSYAPFAPDLDGNPRISGSVVDMGAYEFQGPTAPFVLSQPLSRTVISGSNASFSVTAGGGPPLSYQWSFGGAPLAGATNSSLTLTNIQLAQAGDYRAAITNVAGAITSSIAHLSVRPGPVNETLYVDANSANPVFPFTGWATAAITIQDAIDATLAGDQIIVTNGIYATGGSSGRVTVNKFLAVRSVNGPQFTVIDGSQQVDCVDMTPNNASLSGFTLTNGTRGVVGGVLSNCIVVGNSFGGAFSCTLFDCTVKGNSGGGANSSTLNSCLITGNSSFFFGYGGGAYFCNLNNCTVVSNSASISGGGVYATNATVNNSIIYYNTAPDGPNFSTGPHDRYCCMIMNYCCTTPPYSFSTSNITDEPLFVDLPGGDLRLQSNSPCINAGTNANVATSTDLDGNPRIINGTVDIGAYEFQGSSGFTGFHAWLAQHGLPSDGSADYTDADGDGMNNWQEWRAGTNPTNAASVLRLLSASPGGTGAIVQWQSVLGVGYYVESGFKLTSPTFFTTAGTNIAGQGDTTTFVDTNAAGASQHFYRVGVQ